MIIAKADSAASNTYWREEDIECLDGIKKYYGPLIQLPDNGMIVADRKGVLPLSDELSDAAKMAMILPNLRSASLISMGQLCDDGCDVFFNKHVLLVIKNKNIVLRGIRNRRDNLWDIPIQKRRISPQNYQLPAHCPALHTKINTVRNSKSKKKNTTNIAPHAHSTIDVFRKELGKYIDLTDINILDNQLNRMKKDANTTYCRVNLQPKQPSLAVIVKKKQTHTELVQYMHATCFAPVTSTFETAVKANFLAHG